MQVARDGDEARQSVDVRKGSVGFDVQAAPHADEVPPEGWEDQPRTG